MATFNDIEGLQDFSVTLTGNRNHSQLFKNGKQQVTVYIKIRAYDKKGDTIVLDSTGINQLNANLKLIDYDTSELISKINSAEDPDGTSWSCSVFEGCYDQLPVDQEFYKEHELPDSVPKQKSKALEERRSEQRVFTDGSLIIITRYVMCPHNVTTKDKSIAASVTLNDGTVVTTAKGSLFNSFVRISPLTPLTYHFSNGNLTVETVTSDAKIYDKPNNVDWLVAVKYHKYTVFLTNPKSGSKKCLNMEVSVKRANHDSPSIVGWPTFSTLPEVINSHYYAFAANKRSRATQGSGVCYFWNRDPVESTPKSHTLGIDGFSMPDLNNHYRKNCFNFSAIGFQTQIYYQKGKAELHKLHCSFSDEYGNSGAFIAHPYELGDFNKWAKEIEFLDV